MFKIFLNENNNLSTIKYILKFMSSNDTSGFRCDHCGYSTNDSEQMSKHMLTHVSSTDPERQPFYGMKTMEGEFSGESLAAGWKAMHVTASILWRQNGDIMDYAFSAMNIGPGSSALLLGEDNVGCGFTAKLTETVSPGGEFVDVNFRPDVLPRKFAWPVCTERCAEYDDGSFDAVLYVSWHHMEDMEKEVKALARVVRTGGRVVLLDHGPGHRFFRMAEEEVHVGMLAWLFVAKMGYLHRGVKDLDEAYEVGKALNMRWSSVDAINAMRAAGLKKVRHNLVRGIDIVIGEK